MSISITPKGLLAARYVKALLCAKGDYGIAAAYASGQNWGNEVVACLKAAVTQLGTDESALLGNLEFDFLEYTRPMTLIGRLQGLRRVPSRVRVIAAASGTTGYWAGERNPRPLSRMDFDGEALEPLSAVGISVITNELAQSSNPVAEVVIRDDIGRANVAAMDGSFIDLSNAGTAGVEPASVTNAAPSTPSTGSSLSAIDSDLGTLIDALVAAGSDLQFGAWIMSTVTGNYISRLRGSGGAPAFPQMSARGGTLLGLPCLTSAHVTTVGSPAQRFITLLDASKITVIDDGGANFSVSKTTSLAMADNPSAPSTMVSLFQTESRACKVVRNANWRVDMTGAVQVLREVSY
jgi:capsid protein